MQNFRQMPNLQGVKEVWCILLLSQSWSWDDENDKNANG